MPEAPQSSNSATPEEILAEIHAGLKNESAQTRLDAIEKLEGQNFSSPAILHTLEVLAIKDSSRTVRKAAREILKSSTHRFIQGRTSKLNRKTRKAILDEIDSWETSGFIMADQADVIRQRYDFDLPTTSPKLAVPAAPSQSQPATDKVTSPPPEPESPRPGLTQALLSETSIKIALYLGAFFVIAAAAILAAVLEAARLPILLAATALFAGGAIVTRGKLPQPSFALFIVFSFLLPTDANVLADILNLSDKTNAGYWFGIMAIMALIWSFGTWFYASRLFSLVAFVASVISVVRLVEFFNAEPEIYLLLVSFATLVGLGGAYLLKRWQNTRHSLPLFILVQITQLGLVAFALGIIAIRLEEFPSHWNLASTVFWLLSLIFYVVSDLIFPFVLFPWLAIAALYPLPINLMLTFDVEALPFAIVTWIWGFTLAASSEIIRRLPFVKVGRFGLAASLGSISVVLTGVFIGYVENVTYGFGLILISAIFYSLLHALKPRVYIWTTALLLGLGAYLTFYALPFMENIDIFAGYQLLGASLLLLIPDLVLTPDFSIHKTWRWPPRILGSFLTFFNLSVILPFSMESAGAAAIAYGVYSALFIAYALRYRKTGLGYLATASAALSIIFTLQHFELEIWLFTLTTLSAFFYLLGYVLSRIENQASWSRTLRYSGLGLASMASIWAFVTTEPGGGWYLLVTALLFGIEMYSHNFGLAETGLQIFFAAGVAMLTHEADLERGYQGLAIALTLLGTDLTLARTYMGKRPIAWISRGAGGFVVLLNTLDLMFVNPDAQVSAIGFAIYTLFFLAQALLYHQAILGYGFTLFAVLTTIFGLQAFDRSEWMLPVTGLAIIYYATGFFLRNRNVSSNAADERTTTIKNYVFSWPFILWTSGLAAGLLATAVTPIQGGLSAAIPPAVVATMITVEAFDRRNVWLGFPANALYLMAYFILLIELNVDEPQFFSIATAALGLLMHYLLTRTGSRTGAFITGMVSQLVLLSTTYIQFFSTERLVFFAVLFFQALIVLGYGIVIRSRSLVFTPMAFLVLSVLTVLYGLMQGILAVVLIGCTGLLLLMLGIAAVIMRERLKQISERFSDWRA